MTMKTSHFRLLFILYLLAVAFLCFWKFGELPEVDTKLFGFITDKTVHFCMFLPYPVLLYLALGKAFPQGWKAVLCVLLIFLSGCCAAALTEYIQGFLPYREADAKDFNADTLGLAIGSLGALITDLIRRK